MKKRVLLMVLAGLFVFAFCGSVFASSLISGETYTINFATISSSGQVNPAAYSTTGVANSSGIVNFSLSGVPDNSSCNFMDVTVVAPSGAADYSAATAGVVRESIIPCPTAGSNMPLGISDVTNAQAAALKAAFNAAKTDDPILAVFGLTIVQTSGIDAKDLATIAGYAEQGIMGNGGFINTLETLHSSIINSTSLAIYRKNIVKDLADPNSGYTKFLKEAASTISNSTSQQDMGKAASLILSTLVQATRIPTDTGIHAGWILEGTDAMGNVVLPYLNDPSLWDSVNTPIEVQDTVGAGLDKLRQEVAIQKYENAMTALGASGNDVKQFQSAATTLQNTFEVAMAQFNQTAFANGAVDQNTMDDAQSAFQSATMNAFNTFQNNIQASDAQIGITDGGAFYNGTDPNNMILNICTALGKNAPSDDPTAQMQPNITDCRTILAHMDQQWGMFKWFTQNGQVNWPINMVILANWESSLLKNGGSMSYTRDTTDFNTLKTNDPNDQMLNGWTGFCNTTSITTQNDCNTATNNGQYGNWMSGYCSDQQYDNDQTGATCTGNGYTWTPGQCQIFQSNACKAVGGSVQWVSALSCFGKAGTHHGITEPMTGEEPAQYCQQNPYPYWMMFAIQQDVQVVQELQNHAQQSNQGMSVKAEADFNESLSNIAKAISGTTDGKTAITPAQQQAIMELMSPPQM